jgi:hypothetical protein
VAVFQQFYAFVEHMAEKVHNLGADTLTLALTDDAHPPLVTNTVLANLTQVSYTNCSTRVLTVSASAQSGGVYKLTVDDLVLTASGGTVGPFRYVSVFNDTPTSPADPLIGFYDYGSEITLQDTQIFTFDASAVNGLLQVTKIP